LKKGSGVQGFKDSKWLFIVTVTGIIVFLDFITKKLIEAYVQPYEAINILPFLRIVYIKNPGAAFGILSNFSSSIFIFISILAIIFIGVYLWKTNNKLEVFSLSLILGGAAGNLIDRVTIGKVTDFIDFFIDKWHWPAFNVADSALTIGICLFIWANIKNSKIKIHKSRNS